MPRHKPITPTQKLQADDRLQAFRMNEAAERLHLSYRSVQRLVQRGELRSFTCGRLRLIPAAELLRLLTAA